LPAHGIGGDSAERGGGARVPLDHTHTMSFNMTIGRGVPAAGNNLNGASTLRQLLPNTTDWYGRVRPTQNTANDFLRRSRAAAPQRRSEWLVGHQLNGHAGRGDDQLDRSDLRSQPGSGWAAPMRWSFVSADGWSTPFARTWSWRRG
jgi:hypothetical protein